MADKQQQAYDYFQQKGYSSAQSAGIVANLVAESGLDTSIVGDSGQAYGIAQWHPDRQANFLMWSGKSIRNSTFEEQLAFVDYELKSNPGFGRSALTTATTASQAAAIVAANYERPASKDYSKRQTIAETIHNAAGTGASIAEKLTALFKKNGVIAVSDVMGVLAPGAVAGGVVSGAMGSTGFDLKTWISSNLTGSLWDAIKGIVIPILFGLVAAGLILGAAWGLLKDTAVGDVVKTVSPIK